MYISLLTLVHAMVVVQAAPAVVKGRAQQPNDVTSAGTTTLPSPSVAPGTTGTISTSLLTSGESSVQPFATSVISSVSSTISLSANSSIPLVTQAPAAITASDIFNTPIATGAPASVIASRADHPAPRVGISKNGPIETNKFYANLFLGNQSNSVWTHPYELIWSKGDGNAKAWGISVSHLDASQRAYGPDASKDPVQYYINPIGIQSLVFSAAELGPSMAVTTDSLLAFSANANMHATAGAPAGITFPLVQGMGFVTAIYHSFTPYIESSVFFNTITTLPSPGTGITKYKLLLDDGNTWLLYATASDGSGLSLNVASNTRLAAAAPFSGTIQIAKNPGNDAAQEKQYDMCAGSYATSVSLSASVDGSSGTYTLTRSKGGNGNPLIMFALPHHMQSLSGATTTGIKLQTTTKGVATAVIGDSWTLVEPDMPVSIGFAPWNATTKQSTTSLSDAVKGALNSAGASDLSQDMAAQSNLNSMYYSGKALSKFAAAIYAIHDLAGNVSLASAGLQKLEAAYATFTANKQVNPLVYESAWGGIVSTASYTANDPGVDFGNTYYNDHHFHYSYFVHAAAIIGYLDPSWLSANKEWVNSLIRDVANPSTDDPYFPFSRSFDWYHGHSWAKGLFDSGDGKDEESSSEDTLFAYALKMWGKTIGDQAMEARGNLMLAVMKRSLSNYFLLEDDNVNQPANFIKNKVTGILFENKVDHVTYFGANPEFIQGIHMLPIYPHSAYTRNQKFVQQEWDTYFSNGRVDQVAGGWRGILYSDLALIDPKTAYGWFSSNACTPEYIDGGASRTWYLALAAGLGGGQ